MNEPLSLLSLARVDGLRQTLDAVAAVPGDLAELGVYRGGAARVMAVRNPSRTVHLFDTFTGIPHDGYDADYDRHRPGEWACPLPEVKYALRDCENVRFHAGLFPHTAQGLEDVRFAFVHLDADLYASTFEGLAWFWPRLEPGGVIVLDDWRAEMCPGVDRAVFEYFGVDYPHATFSESAEHQLAVTKRH